MKSFFELPEYQIFHILRNGDAEPCGPYSQDQLVWLLNQEELNRSDLVYFPGLDRWKPLHEVFEFHDRVANFQCEGHDPEVLNRAFLELSRLCREDEELYDIAIEHKPLLPSRGRRVVATGNLGLWVGQMGRKGEFSGGRIGWDEIERVSAHFPSRWDQGVLAVELACGSVLELKRIPRRQIRRIVSGSRELAAMRWNEQWRRPGPFAACAEDR